MGDDYQSLVMENYWEAKHYGDLGLLDILTLQGYIVAQDMEESVANHIVRLHNNWYEIELWRTYMSNIAWTFSNTLL
jgi:hypothetical protein